VQAPPFSLRQLAYFLAAAEHGSMTAAARAAFVSQSAVSLAVADLERTLGTQLFIRHHAQGLSLTDAGRRVAPLARDLLGRAGELAETARELDDELSGSLTVACYDTIAPFVLPRLLTGFDELHPRVELTIREGNMAELHRLVRAGEAELMICYDLDLGADIDARPLATTRPYVLMAPDHHLAGSSEIALTALRDEPMILLDQPQSARYFLGLFEAAGVTPTIRYRTQSFEMVRSLVARSLGYSLLIQRPAGDVSYEGLPVICRPVANPGRRQTIVAGTPRGARPTRRCAAFVEHAAAELTTA
jgi:DNA-binding transcriptional LysR family regulator